MSSNAYKKGKFLEEIISKMYQSDGMKVIKNAYVKPLHSSKQRKKREIDILILNEIAGIDIKIAIECKNIKKPVISPQIDSFIGKLQDVGIPIQQGIFISSSGFTKGAIERAQKVGIQTLSFEEVTHKQINKSMNIAFQSVIYLLCSIDSMSVTNVIPYDNYDFMFFYNDKNEICGTLLDIVWMHWNDETIPNKLGRHQIELQIPSRWNQMVNGKIVPLISAEAVINVFGLVLNIPGKVDTFILKDFKTQQVTRKQINIEFKPKQRTRLKKFIHENSLNKYLSKKNTIKITIGRFKLPRIVYNKIYWPPSHKALSQIFQIIAEKGESILMDPNEFTLEKIEGTDINAIWDPIYSKYLGIFNSMMKK